MIVALKFDKKDVLRQEDGVVILRVTPRGLPLPVWLYTADDDGEEAKTRDARYLHVTKRGGLKLGTRQK